MDVAVGYLKRNVNTNYSASAYLAMQSAILATIEISIRLIVRLSVQLALPIVSK